MMKYLIFCLFVLSTACEYLSFDPKDSQANDSTAYLEKWQLVEMSGQLANTPPATGDDMDWQEHYLLYEDDTFLKVRERNNKTRQARGTYAYVTQSDDKYLELSYPAENELIGNCYQEPKELLMLTSEEELIGTWQACDGPGLVYEKVE